MKKFLSLLFLCLVAVMSASAQCEVTFNGDEDYGNLPAEAGPFSVSKDGVSVDISNGLVTGGYFRVYKGQTMTICSQIGDIVGIDLYCYANDDAQYGPGCFTVNVGTYGFSAKVGSWRGRSHCVTFTASLNQVRISKFVVYVDCEGVLAAPVIAPTGGIYYEPIEVSMTCRTDGAEIHYTTDGSDPTAASKLYEAPFTVSETTVVKAISSLDGEVSNVVAATYEFIDADDNVVHSIAEALTKPQGTVIYFDCEVYVLTQCRNYMFIKDNTAYTLIYGNCGQNYEMGDVIPRGFVATSTIYSGEHEFIQPRNFMPSQEHVVITSEVVTINDVKPYMFAHLVLFENVSIVKVDDRNYQLVDEDGNVCPVYFGTLCATAPADLSGTFNVTAIIGSYGSNPVYQVLPIKIERVKPGQPIGFGDLFDMDIDPDNPEVTMGYDATVLAQRGNYLYAKDETGYGLVYGPTGQTYERGDVIPAGFGGNLTFYNCEPELSRPTGFEPAIGHVDVTPEPISVSQINEEHWAHFVILHNVWFDASRKVIIDEDGNEASYYNGTFDFIMPQDLSKPYDVCGIVGSYGRNGDCIYQLLPINANNDTIELGCFGDLIGLPERTVVTFVQPLIVVMQASRDLYLKDGCGSFGLLYGNIDDQFINGDLVVGSARISYYQGNIQLTPIGEWEKVGHTSPVEPEYLPIEEVSQAMVHSYLGFRDMKVTHLGSNNYLMEDETGSMMLFNRYNITIPTYYYPAMPDLNLDNELNIADLNRLIDFILSGKANQPWPDDDGDSWYPCTVHGLLSVYHGELELFPVLVETTSHHGYDEDDPRYYDLNDDREINIADVNVLLDLIFEYNR